MRLRFSAPWSTSVTVITGLVLALVVVMGGIGLVIGVVVLVGVLAISAYFAVLGYVVEVDTVAVRRPGWQTRLPLEGLESVEADPDAMRGSLRTFGIGGLFAFVGRFRNGRLGPYRAYATDPARAVVLCWTDRTVVVTPDDPETFVAAVAAVADLA